MLWHSTLCIVVCIYEAFKAVLFWWWLLWSAKTCNSFWSWLSECWHCTQQLKQQCRGTSLLSALLAGSLNSALTVLSKMSNLKHLFLKGNTLSGTLNCAILQTVSIRYSRSLRQKRQRRYQGSRNEHSHNMMNATKETIVEMSHNKGHTQTKFVWCTCHVQSVLSLLTLDSNACMHTRPAFETSTATYLSQCWLYGCGLSLDTHNKCSLGHLALHNLTDITQRRVDCRLFDKCIMQCSGRTQIKILWGLWSFW